MLRKFRFPEFPKLMQDETFVLETRLTRDEAIARLQGQIKMPLFSFKAPKASANIEFAGNLTPDGFKVVPYLGAIISSLTNFHPPLITGTWKGDTPVSIEGRIKFSKFHKVLILLFQCFDILFTSFVIFLSQFYLLMAYSSADLSAKLGFGLLGSFLSYIVIAVLVLGLSLAFCFALRARFSRSMIIGMNQSFVRSRKIFFEFFEVESPDP